MLWLNVGFMLKETAGYKRTFELDAPLARVADDLQVTHLRGQVLLTRTPQGLYANGRIVGEIQAECARCLHEFSQALIASVTELFVYPPQNAATDEPVATEEGFIDLGPIVREDLLLSAPMRTLCRPDCRGLCPYCGLNRNEGSCSCAEGNTDLRLAALRVFLEK